MENNEELREKLRKKLKEAQRVIDEKNEQNLEGYIRSGGFFGMGWKKFGGFRWRA